MFVFPGWSYLQLKLLSSPRRRCIHRRAQFQSVEGRKRLHTPHRTTQLHRPSLSARQRLPAFGFSGHHPERKRVAKALFQQRCRKLWVSGGHNRSVSRKGRLGAQTFLFPHLTPASGRLPASVALGPASTPTWKAPPMARPSEKVNIWLGPTKVLS